MRAMKTEMQEGLGRIDSLSGKVEDLEHYMKASRSSAAENMRKFEERVDSLEASRVEVSGEPRSKRARSAGSAVGRNVDRAEHTVDICGFRYSSIKQRTS